MYSPSVSFWQGKRTDSTDTGAINGVCEGAYWNGFYWAGCVAREGDVHLFMLPKHR